MPMSLVRATNLRAQLPDLREQIQNFGTPAQGSGAARAALSCKCGTPVAVRAKEASKWDLRFSGQTGRFFIPGPVIVRQVTRPSTTLRRAHGPKVQISRATTPRMMHQPRSKQMAT